MEERKWADLYPTSLMQSSTKSNLFNYLIGGIIMLKGIVKVVIALVALGTGVELGRRGLGDLKGQK